MSDKDEAKDKPEAEEAPAPTKGFRVDLGSKLTELSTAACTAYAVDMGGDRNTAYALVGQPQFGYRAGVLAATKLKKFVGGLAVLDYFPVAEASGKNQRLAVIMERPDGPPLSKSMTQPMSEVQVIELVTKPICRLLEDLHSRGIVHRAIRPDNLFFRRGTREIVLGPYGAEPPGMLQPSEFEPVERGVATPFARGEGAPPCDMYALGVTVLHLACGSHDLAGKSDLEIFSAKCILGSYRALVGRRSVPMALEPMIRGLLSDVAADRWKIEDIANWLGGRTRRVSDSGWDQVAPEPFSFAGATFRSPQLLGVAMARNPKLGMDTLRTKTIIPWLKNNVKDEYVTTAVTKAYQHFSFEESVEGNALFMLLMSMALARNGGMHFRGVTMNFDALPYVLTFAFETNNEGLVSALGELLRFEIFALWKEFQQKYGSMSGEGAQILTSIDQPMNTTPDSQRRVIRLLYALNPGQRCLSPMTRDRFVSNPEAVLAALDSHAEKFGTVFDALDYHITSFVRAREAFVDRTVQAMETQRTNEENYAGHLFNVLGHLHTKSGGSFVKLATFMQANSQLLVERFRSRSKRDQVVKALVNEARKGDVGAVNQMLNSPDADRDDYSRFRAAFARYKALEVYIKAAQEIFTYREAGLMKQFTDVQTLVSLTSVLGSVVYSFFKFAF
ncbi:MAG: hypothetical protein FJX46_02005 [Alphaproteobacteria bacterium]|nr:hypothetical protein [Alphaproteobacteria bacterium]